MKKLPQRKRTTRSKSQSRRSTRRNRIQFERLEPRMLLDAGGLVAPLETSLDRADWQDVDADGGPVWISVTLDEATDNAVQQALQAYGQHLARGHSAEVFELAPLKIRLVNASSFERSLHYGSFVGLYDNVVEGTWRSETLTGTAARDLIVGHGGNDTLVGLGNSDILIGGAGDDLLNGSAGDDVMLYAGTNNGYDRFDGGSGRDRAVAADAGTVIGIAGYENGVESFEGRGDTLIRATWRSETLDFTATGIADIAEVDAGSGNDTVFASHLSSAAYRGGSGNDQLYAGAMDTVWLYDGTGNGYDKFLANTDATVTAQAGSAGTVIGIDGYENGVDVVVGFADGDTRVQDTWRSNTLDFSATQLVDIAEVDAGSGNDKLFASDVTAGYYRGGSGDDQLYAGAMDTVWLYDGTGNGYDTFWANSDAMVTARADSAGTVIGIDGYENGVDVFVGFADGDTIVQDTWRSNLLDFSSTQLVDIAEVDAGSGNDKLFASDVTAGYYRGGSGDDQLYAGGGETIWLYDGTGNGYDRLLGNGESLVTARADSAGTVIGVNGYENGVDVVVGFADGDTVIQDSWRSNALDFSSTQFSDVAEVNAGSGNDKVMASDLTPGNYRGGSGDDQLTAGAAATVWLYEGTNNGYDQFYGNQAATVTARAEAAGTVIGVNGYDNGVDVVQGYIGGDTVVRDSWRSNTLDFSNTRLEGVAEIDAASGNDTIIASDFSPGSYRGGSGDDTLHAGVQDLTWLYAGTNNGYDALRSNMVAQVTARAETAETVIGILGYENGVDLFAGYESGDTIVRNSWHSHTLDFSSTRFLDILEVDGASGNDTLIASDLTAGAYRGGSGNDKLVAGSQPVTWLYAGVNDGADSFEHRGQAQVQAVSDAPGLPDGPTAGTTGSGLDLLVDIILADPGLNGRVDPAEIAAGAAAADAMNHLILEAVVQTGLANDGEINTADMRDLGDWLRSNYANQWLVLHGDDESYAETGFHLVQNDGATTRLFGANNAVDTVADGLYHMGFEIVGDRFLNEDGNRNVRVETAAHWLNTLLLDDLAAGTLVNPAVNPYTVATTGTGLDQLIEIVNSDPGLNQRIPTSEIAAGSAAADAMNQIIVQAITALGLANDGTINTADVRDINTYIQANYYQPWIDLHGDDEGDEETGFHLVQNDGATSRLFDNHAVDTVADGIYHLGFDIAGDNVLNEDGNRNARVETIAAWFNSLLRDDLANGSLANPNVNPYAEGTTGTGLDSLVEIVTSDPGLNRRIATSEITAGAVAADAMNQLIVQAIIATGVGHDGEIDIYDMYEINAYLQANHYDDWVERHGDDEGDAETGFHLVQNDGATTRLYGTNAVNTVADGVYHIGFDIVSGRFLNEDGNKNVSVETAAYWLDDLLEQDLASGNLANPALVPDAAEIAAAEVLAVDEVVMTGPDDYLEIPHTDALAVADGTIALAFTADEVSGRSTLFSKDANDYGAGGHVTAFVRDGRIEVRLQSDSQSQWLYAESLIRPGEPHHVAVSFGADGFRLYVDGKLEAMKSDFTSGIAANPENLVIGANTWARNSYRPDWTADYFAGTIEDFAVYNRALSRLEIASLGGSVAGPKPTSGTTGTGLDGLVDIIDADLGLYRRISPDDIAGGAAAADALNHLIIDAVVATGLANDGEINAADMRDLNAWIQNHHYQQWVELHGDDEGDEETGFHLVQNDGAMTRLFAQNAVNTVADGLYHIGFDIVNDRFLNEDGNQNVSVETAAWWLDELLEDQLADGSLRNPAVEPYAQGSTGTGLDALVEIVASDPGLNYRIPTSEITAGAMAADAMNGMVVAGITALGIANDGVINTADVRDLNAWIQANHYEQWVELHGDDEDGEETGFHLVQNDGADSRLFDDNAVNTVADGIYHLGFDIVGDRLLNEDGNANARVERVAWWLNELLAEDLAAGTLANASVNASATGTTGTGLDQLIAMIADDPGLNQRIATSEIAAGARAADAMNQIILEAIRSTGAADDGAIDALELVGVNAYVQAHHGAEWTELHGDDENGEETGFHLVQNDGAITRLFAENGVNTVADGIYHLGFDIERFAFQNEDGNRNAELEDVAHWLTLLLRQDLANGTLSSQGDSGNQAVPQPTAAAQAADAVFAELGS